MQVPRCYFNVYTKPRQIELHGFSDASRRAYAAAVYIRSVYDGGSVQVQLVASKSRVAPIKEQSIPRLELLGAVILARLCSKIKATIGELDTTYWVDSMTTLCWIKNEKHWKQYVQHRVEEIRRLSPRHAWRYCPGPMNPADLPSRGVSAKELSSKKSWWNGPEFLLTPPSEWPPDDPSTRVNDQALQEAAKFSPTITHSMVNKETNNPEKGVDQIIQVEQYSSLQRLLRVTATVLRFIRRLKMRVAGKLDLTTTTNRDVEDMRSSEVLWIKAIQRSSFQDEMEFLSEGESKGAKNPQRNYVHQFGLFIDAEGVMRCKGRINNSPLAASSKNPVLLPGKHHFVELLIVDTHNWIKHSGLRDTLTTLREQLWILRGRETVKKIIRHGVVCRKYEGVPFKTQTAPDLPAIRVSDDPPFAHVGLDFAGPLYIHPQSYEKSSFVESNSRAKVYICLFTCASTRAVHLELTRGVSAEAFFAGIQAIRQSKRIACDADLRERKNVQGSQ